MNKHDVKINKKNSCYINKQALHHHNTYIFILQNNKLQQDTRTILNNYKKSTI